MAQKWASRMRDTSTLVRSVAQYAFRNGRPNPGQLYGLCKLTWITESFDISAAPYIVSTKIPALGDVFKRDFAKQSLESVAVQIAQIVGEPTIKDSISRHTGFTNFYKAYRNVARDWIDNNYGVLLPLFRAAFESESDSALRAVIAGIAKLPPISLNKGKGKGMRPEYLLTPVFASLDQRGRFPIINGNRGVQKVLTSLGVHGSDLVEQYDAMISLYGKNGIEDFADLDQVGADLKALVDLPGHSATKKLLKPKPLSPPNALSLKDEDDIVSIKKAAMIKQKRIHNKMTNRFWDLANAYTLFEGGKKSAMYDIVVRQYDGENDLLIEVKSLTEDAHVRMAIGQLYAYGHQLIDDGEPEPHLAILLPSKPATRLATLLAWLDIGLMWFDGRNYAALDTEDKWLLNFVKSTRLKS
jgi:hypothetical protein